MRSDNRPERAVAYVGIDHKNKKELHRRVVSSRAFCAGRGIQLVRVFAGRRGPKDAYSQYRELRRASDYSNIKKNGISTMVIPDLGSIGRNADAHSMFNMIQSDLNRDGIKLQRIY